MLVTVKYCSGHNVAKKVGSVHLSRVYAMASAAAGFRRRAVANDDVRLSYLDNDGDGPVVVALHGLAGTGDEFIATAAAVGGSYRFVLPDLRGHANSTRRPADVSRAAFIDDVAAVIRPVSPDRPVTLVGQSMGGHTAILAAASFPDLVARLVVLEATVAVGTDPVRIGDYFRSWPRPFASVAEARQFLGQDTLAQSWIGHLEPLGDGGLVPTFDAGVMQSIMAGVSHPRSRAKVLGQVVVAAVFGLEVLQHPDGFDLTRADARLSFLKDFGPILGTLPFVIWAVIMTVGASNAENLADGLDGLATGLTIVVLAAYVLIGIWQERNECADFLSQRRYQVRDPLDMAVVAASVLGACIGYLWWNTPPAKIMMGDTGSLALGGVLAGLAICTKTQLLLGILGGLLVIITVSDVIQIGVFKVTRIRTGDQILADLRTVRGGRPRHLLRTLATDVTPAVESH